MWGEADKWVFRWFRKAVLRKKLVPVGPFPWDALVADLMKGAALGTVALLVYVLLGGQ